MVHSKILEEKYRVQAKLTGENPSIRDYPAFAPVTPNPDLGAFVMDGAVKGPGISFPSYPCADAVLVPPHPTLQMQR